MITIAILGLGNRGRRYAAQIKANKDAKLVAVCDINPKILNAYKERYGLDDAHSYLSDDEFFKAGKLADALVIATQDRDHYRHAMAALNLGYKLLLEKPVSPEPEECQAIADKAAELDLPVVVCHVLRYSPFYIAIKKYLDDGAIGDVVSVNDTENIGYWHYAHSYVRGNWRREDESAPSILAKSCHDLDIIYYFSGKKPVSVFSSGKRALFLPKNAPEGSADYCLDPCPHLKTCPYSARNIYYGLTRYSVPHMIVHMKVVTGLDKPKLKDLKQALKTSPYGRCVYKCDNDVIENQNVAIKLEDNVSGNLTMTAFSKGCFRRLHISGTKGEIIGIDKENKFKLNIFGGKCKTIKVKSSGVFGHFGGDKGVISDFVEYLKSNQKHPRLSTIDTTLESHKMAFAAEKSRKTGKCVDV